MAHVATGSIVTLFALAAASCVGDLEGVNGVGGQGDVASLGDDPEEFDVVGEAADELSINGTVVMRYEGSCAWLACASIYCGVQGCAGAPACSDTQPWVARPYKGKVACGTTVRVCNPANGKCVDAVVRDNSESAKTASPYWEGNKAVFLGLGLVYGPGKNFNDGVCNCAPCTGINSCKATPGKTGTWGTGQVTVNISTPNAVIVDDLDSGFTKAGPSAYWKAYTGGNCPVGTSCVVAGHQWYTTVNGSVASNSAKWKPVLPSAGTYTIQAFIPYGSYATATTAKYKIYHQGVTNTVTTNQNTTGGEWLTIGSFYFSANGSEYVELTDATGESTSTGRKVGFDAMEFRK